jgi:hypothetical protein
MSLDLLAIDLGKQSFHIHGIDSDGVIISRKISRAKLIGAIEELAPAVIGGLRQRALLGPAVPRRGPSDPADQSTLREAVRQRIKKRRGGCRRNLRSSYAPDDAFRAGQID